MHIVVKSCPQGSAILFTSRLRLYGYDLSMAVETYHRAKEGHPTNIYITGREEEVLEVASYLEKSCGCIVDLSFKD